MAYGRRKKSSKVRGKSLIKDMTKVSTPPPAPIINETPPPPAQMESNQETNYQTETPSITIDTPTPPADVDEILSSEIIEEPVVEAPKQKRVKRKKKKFKKPFVSKDGFNPQPIISKTPIEPQPLPEPEIQRVPVVKNLYDGANVRTFYGIKDTPIGEFITNVLKDIPLFKIDEIDQQGNVLNTFQLKNKKMGGKKQKKKKRKFSIIRGDTKTAYKTKSKQEQQSLTKIVEENRYNISIDGVAGQTYSITFMGLENPDEVSAYMYDDPPIVEIPASLPESYQNSANEDVEELKDGRRCGNCIFYDPEVSVCNKWNAEVRQNYWCLSWQTMAPVISEPNQFTQYIEEDGDIYNYLIDSVKDPISQEPNLSNFLSPLNSLFTTYGAYIYGDYLRRIVDSGNAFDYDGIPLNFFFTTQDGFLNAIDFINNSNLGQFNDPPEEYDSIQQSLVTYTLTKKSTSTLPSNYPQTITINLHGQYYGEPRNILSQLDLVNAKIAYNPQLTANSHHILKDNRFVDLETNGQLHIDIVKQSIRERVLKFLVDNSKPYMLDGTSAYKFTQWVANRSAFTETMQSLYQVILNSLFISSANQELLDAMELSLSEQLFDNPSTTIVPLITEATEGEDEEQT